MWRFLMVSLRQREENSKWRSDDHQTFWPEASISLISRLFSSRLAADVEREGVVIRQRQVDLLARDQIAGMALEIEVEPHRHAAPALVLRDLDPHPFRGAGRPVADLLETVEQLGARRRRASAGMTSARIQPAATMARQGARTRHCVSSMSRASVPDRPMSTTRTPSEPDPATKWRLPRHRSD